MSLEEKAIEIKGKQYVLAKDRVIFFNENYPNGCIKNYLLSDTKDERVIIKTEVYPDIVNQPNRFFIGHSQAVIGDGYINKTSALENAETSSTSRALAMMGIGIIESIASADEINKADIMAKQKPAIQQKKEVIKESQKEIIRKKIATMIKENKFTKETITDTMIGLYAKDKYDDLTEDESISLILVLEEKIGN